jgi:hypothetical protein
LTHGTLTHHYAHHTKLGRHQVLDARSLEWLHEHTGSVLKPAAHAPRIPVLDQEDLLAQGIAVSAVVAGAKDVDALGSCTGNAGAAAVSVLLDDDQARQAGLDVSSAKGAEEFAIGLYAQATGLDDADGVFPPGRLRFVGPGHRQGPQAARPGRPLCARHHRHRRGVAAADRAGAARCAVV